MRYVEISAIIQYMLNNNLAQTYNIICRRERFITIPQTDTESWILQ